MPAMLTSTSSARVAARDKGHDHVDQSSCEDRDQQELDQTVGFHGRRLSNRPEKPKAEPFDPAFLALSKLVLCPVNNLKMSDKSLRVDPSTRLAFARRLRMTDKDFSCHPERAERK